MSQPAQNVSFGAVPAHVDLHMSAHMTKADAALHYHPRLSTSSSGEVDAWLEKKHITGDLEEVPGIGHANRVR
jgi:hypothetical protein